MTRILVLLLALLMAGCASIAYRAATDERSLSDQAADATIIAHARSVEGVTSVKPFIQVKQ